MANFNRKAQGALEYLLIIGGAIVLVAIVIAIIINMTGKTSVTANDKFNDFNTLIHSTDVNTTATVAPTVSYDKNSEKAIIAALGDAYRNVVPKLTINPGSAINISNLYNQYKLKPATDLNLDVNFYQKICDSNPKNITCQTYDQNFILQTDLSLNDLKYWFFVGYFSGEQPLTLSFAQESKCIADNNYAACYKYDTNYNFVSGITIN